MTRKIFLNASAFLAVLVFLAVVFVSGKEIKQKWIIYKTLQSRHWKERTAEIESAEPGKYKVVFLGNSLTELFDLNYYFGDSTILNCGIVGDFTEGLVKRSDAVIRLKPGKLFIEIGINDIIEQVPLEVICENYGELIDRVKAGSPQTKIYVQSNLPVIINRPGLFVGDKEVNDLVRRQNLNLERLAESKGVTFIDLHGAFVRSGYLKDLLVADGIHLTHKAYGVWRLTLLPHLQQAQSLR